MLPELLFALQLLDGVKQRDGMTPSDTPPKSYVEQPPKNEVGHMSFAEWEKIYAGSYLDYTDWLKGV